MPDKWEQYATPAQPAPDKWSQYAVSPATSPTLPPEFGTDTFRAAVHSQMLGIDPGMAYQGRDEIDHELRAVSPNYDDGKIDDSILNDLKVGWESSILGLTHRKTLPEQVRDPGMVDKFITGVSQTVADIPAMIAGGIMGGAAGSEVPVVGTAIGAGAGAFALPAAAREALVQGIKHGDVTSFSDILHRMAHVTAAGAKGAAVGAVTTLTGDIPVGSFIAKSGLATTAVKGLYQATAMTTAADLLDGKLPSKDDFAGNAALIVPLNLITHGMAMGHGDVEQAAMDVYAKDGKTPENTAATLTAQPPVKPDLPDGLRPAINLGESVIDGDTTENHAELAARTLRTKPVSMEELEADPALADDVLQDPKIHEQPVIDRAWQLKREALETGESEPPAEGEEKPLTIDDLYDRASMKSGRGFVTPDGKFLSRMEARKWMKDNEPDVHEMWTTVSGDKSAELHSEQYAEARNRVQARNVADGEPALNGMSPLEVRRRAAARKDLNDIKAGLTSKRYAFSAIRTMFTGERDYRIGLTKAFHDRLEKVIPDYRDQEALTYLRDYKGNENALREKIEAVNAGDDEKEKALNPSRERALNPSPQLLEADRMMTEYMKWALQDGQPYGLYQNSRIDPSHYSPHLLGKVLEEGEEPRGTGSAGFTKRTSHDIERKYATIDEATGKKSIEARTVNSLESLVEYGNKHATAVAIRSLLTEFKNTQLGMVGSRDDVPEGWVRLAPNMPEFTRSMLSKDSETGENKAISQSFFVPKEVAQAMRPIVTHDVVSSSPGYRTLAKLQGVTKAMELGFSLFHLKSEALQALNNAKYTDLMHAWGGDVTPEDAREWGADGLVTSETKIPYEAWGKLKQSSLPSRLDYLRELPVIKQIDEAASWVTSKIFDTVLPKFKITSANLKLAAWESDHPEATDQETFAARREIAKQVNSVFGGLNWEAMGWDKNALKLMRLVMLAPDWTFSNVMGLKYAALDRGVAGNASRMFLFRSFATGLLATQALSYGLSGQASENPTEVYLGTDKNGKKLYANWFFAGLPKDMHTLLQQVLRNGAETGLINTLANKLGPIAGAANRLQKNQDWEGKPIVKKNQGSVEKTAREIGFSAGQFLPFAATNAYDAVKNMVMDTDHEYTQQQFMEVLGDVMGAQVYHERTPRGTSARDRVLPGRGSQRRNKFSIRSAR